MDARWRVGGRAAAIGGLLLATTLSAADGKPPRQSPDRRSTIAVGRQVFQTGSSPSGVEITATLAGGTTLPASALPCSTCHGEDGRGNPEGGVSPTDLTWGSLTRPYDVETARGRTHGPYDRGSLQRAITLGVDPAGNELHVSMPRYQMSVDDLDALVLYIRQLGSDRDPGIGPKRLRIGTVLPPPEANGGQMAEVGRAIEAALRAWVAEVNAGGGLYGRTLELEVLTLPADRTGWAAAFADLLDPRDEESGLFALVGAFLAGWEAEAADLLREHRVPLVGPFTQYPRLERPVNPWVFYLLPGLAVQCRAMVRFELARAAEDPGGPPGTVADAPPAPGAVLYPERNPTLERIAREMQAEAGRAGWKRFEVHAYTPNALDALGIASALATAGSESVFFLGSPRDRQVLLEGAEHFAWRPRVFTPGSMAGPDALATPAWFDGRMFLSFPTLPDDHSPGEVAAYRRLADEHELPSAHLAVQLSTLAAAHLLAEGVERAGRDLSRSRLVAELEALYKWESGLTPLLTFTPNRRIGARGAYVVRLDLERRAFRRVGSWIGVD